MSVSYLFSILALAPVNFAGHPSSDYPKTCPNQTVFHEKTWATRYFNNDCVVDMVENSTRSGSQDIDLVLMSPYVGALGDVMTMAEPLMAAAAQEIEDGSLLPGFRLKFHLVDSRCSAPDATLMAIRAMSTLPTKYGLIGDSCSGCCVAINDALQVYHALQISPNCISTALSDADRHPYFARVVPSFRYNVIAAHGVAKLMKWQRVGIIHGPRAITKLAKDIFIELVEGEAASDIYPWTILFTESAATAEDAHRVLGLVQSRDSRVTFTAVYQDVGVLLICAAAQRGLAAPELVLLGASGWWNQNFLADLAASTECSVEQLYRAGYGFIGFDRGGMQNSAEVHGLSGRTQESIYQNYFEACAAFAGGEGACNFQWSGYFYDAMWHFASLLHTYLIQEGGSFSTLASPEAVKRLYELSLQADYMGVTGHVRQFNDVDPRTSAAGGSFGDRVGPILLRQLTRMPPDEFSTLGYWSEDTGLELKADIMWSFDDPTQRLSCTGSVCDFAGGWVPPDRSDGCTPGFVWNLMFGCEACAAGRFTGELQSPACDLCSAGSYSAEQGSSSCVPCPEGTYGPSAGLEACEPCKGGRFSGENQSTECGRCSEGRFQQALGASACSACPSGTFQREQGQLLCQCEVGFYKSGEDTTLGGSTVACLPCNDTIAGSTTKLPGTTAKSGCICPEGQFVRMNSSACEACLSGMTCPMGSAEGNFIYAYAADSTVAQAQPALLPGYWSSTSAPLSVFRCDSTHHCPGGPIGSCGFGLERASCSHCAHGWHWANLECRRCTSVEMSKVLFPVLPTVAMSIVIAGLYRFSGDDLPKWGSWQNSIATSAFILLNHYQTIAIMRKTSITLPTQAMNVFNVWEFSNDFLSIFRADCTGVNDTRTVMLLNMFGPVFILVLMLINFGFSRILASKLNKPQLAYDKNRLFNIYMSLIFTFFAAIASMAMNLFKCQENPNGMPTLNSDLSIVCQTSQWYSLLAICVVSTLLYVVGIFALFIRTLWIAPTHFDDPEFQARWKFLFVKFRPGCYWWALPFMLKTILFDMALASVPTPTIQMFAICSLSMGYLFSVMYWMPYRFVRCDHFDVYAHCCITTIAALLCVFAYMESNGEDMLTVSIMAIVISFMPIVLWSCYAVNRAFYGLQEKFGSQEYRARVQTRFSKEVASVMTRVRELAKISDETALVLFSSMSDFERACFDEMRRVVTVEVRPMSNSQEGRERKMRESRTLSGGLTARSMSFRDEIVPSEMTRVDGETQTQVDEPQVVVEEPLSTTAALQMELQIDEPLEESLDEISPRGVCVV